MKLRMSTVRIRFRFPQPTRSGSRSASGISRRTFGLLVQRERGGKLRSAFAFDVAAVARDGEIDADLPEPVAPAPGELHHLVLVAVHAASKGEHSKPELGARVHRGAELAVHDVRGEGRAPDPLGHVHRRGYGDAA